MGETLGDQCVSQNDDLVSLFSALWSEKEQEPHGEIREIFSFSRISPVVISSGKISPHPG